MFVYAAALFAIIRLSNGWWPSKLLRAGAMAIHRTPWTWHSAALAAQTAVAGAWGFHRGIASVSRSLRADVRRAT
jgi:hypothetical protein